MEKYSAYRDPGTGIQPFLTPVSPQNTDFHALSTALLPVQVTIGAIRSLIVLLLALVYFVLVDGVFSIFLFIPPLYRLATNITTRFLARLVLLCLGVIWIPVEIVARKRGRGLKASELWNPGPGDIIVSNWVSWLELLWLAYRFNPIFVLPVPQSNVFVTASTPSTPITHTPGRRSGYGTSNTASISRTPIPQIPIVGFEVVSLFTMIRQTGHVPPYAVASGSKPQTLQAIRKTADRPVVVFPECTSSNGRGLLRVSEVFNSCLPLKGWNVFVMCVRYDPPTAFSPTLSHSIPSTSLNPVHHLFTLASSLVAPSMSVRLLSTAESPSSPLFMASEVMVPSTTGDQLSEVCAALMAQLGKFKRTSMGWEDKAMFLDFYRGKNNPK